MSDAPSVLLLDDGELDHVHRMLKRIGADYVRLQGRKIGSSVQAPRDLLIASCQRTLDMPHLETPPADPNGPTWVCVHSQDFLPLRERLKNLGVHYLVHSALDAESLRLFLLQVLHGGPDRRSHPRLPLGDPIRYALAGGPFEPAKLADLSLETCRILSPCTAAPDQEVHVVLPEKLGGGERLELRGQVLRCAECESRSGQPVFSIVVRLSGLDAEERAQIERVVRGEQIGTRVTPLAARAARDAQPLDVEARHEAAEPGAGVAEPPAAEAPLTAVERRRHGRREYDRRVYVFDFDDSDASHVAIGHDLSPEGVRIVGVTGLEVGTRARLALYGGRREEPVVIEAKVLRDDGDAGLTFRFEALGEDQQKGLAKLLDGLSHLESLRDDSRQRDGIVVAQVSSVSA